MLIVVVSIILFGSYAGLRFASLPVLAYSCDLSKAGTLVDASVLNYDSMCPTGT